MGTKASVVLRSVHRVSASTAAAMVGRAVNVALPFVILRIHGTDSGTDVFFLTLAFIFFVQGTLSNALAHAQIPYLIRDPTRRSLRRTLQWGIGTGLATTAATLWSLPAEQATHHYFVIGSSVFLASSFGLIAAPAVAALNADHRYVMPGLTWAFRIIPITIYALKADSETAVSWLLMGISLADVSRTIVLITLARPRLSLSGKHAAIELPLDALFLVGSNVLIGLTPLFIRWLLASGEVGALSIFEAADRVYAALASLATIGAGNVALVYLVRSETAENSRTYSRWFTYLSIAWSILWLLAALWVWLLFPTLKGVLALEDKATFDSIRNTFLLLSLGMPGFVMGAMLSRRIIALGMASRLPPMALAGLVIATGSSLMLHDRCGVTGVALSLTVSKYAVLALMCAALYRNAAKRLALHRSGSVGLRGRN